MASKKTIIGRMKIISNSLLKHHSVGPYKCTLNSLHICWQAFLCVCIWVRATVYQEIHELAYKMSNTYVVDSRHCYRRRNLQDIDMCCLLKHIQHYHRHSPHQLRTYHQAEPLEKIENETQIQGNLNKKLTFWTEKNDLKSLNSGVNKE